MSREYWSSVSYLDAIRPDPGWRTEYAILGSYSADLMALVAALLALAGLDDDRGSGSKVDLANATEQLSGRVRLIVQAGRLIAPAKSPKILAILDKYIHEVNCNETFASWHPKVALTKQVSEQGLAPQWRIWIGSRNLTRDISWDTGLSLVGQQGDRDNEIPGIAEMGYILAKRAQLPSIYAGTVKKELRQVKWCAPPGCTLNTLQLLSENSSRGLPQEPKELEKLVVVSPFLDGSTIGKLGKWGDEQTNRILISTRPELAKLVDQKKKPLNGFNELLFLDVPISDEQSANDSIRKQDSESEEEIESRGLHAKLIYAEGLSERKLWIGSANATQRGWDGPNVEIMSELTISEKVAAGLHEFVKSATTVRFNELGNTIEDPAKAQLEDARKQVSSSWHISQRRDNDGPFLSSPSDPNPSASEIKLYIGILGTELLLWPRGETSLRLPRLPLSESTEFVCCRLTLGSASVSWIQLCPIHPSLGRERDEQAMAHFLDPRTFLLWIKTLLTDEVIGDGSGDWDSEENVFQRQKSSQTPIAWWAPTIEEILHAWSRDPDGFIEIEKKVRYYLKLYEKLADIEYHEEERKALDDFKKTWQVLRRELGKLGQ